VYLDEVIIETTRRCNMQCSHCLRGRAENKEMSKKHINNFLQQLDYIDTVTFTGGEPTLPSGLKIIDYFIEACRVYKVDLGNFYIVTNAKVWRPEFPKLIHKLYNYCSDNDITGISISGDRYHEQVPRTSFKYQLEDKFELMGIKINIDIREPFSTGSIINEGRGQQYGSNRYAHTPEISIECDDDEDYGNLRTEAEIYLNCEGNIINGCDWSYKSQRKSEHIICKASDDLKQALIEKATNVFCYA